MQDEFQVGNIGSAIVLRVVEDESPVDLSSATEMKVYLKPPTGTTDEHTGEWVTDGTDGLMRYVTTDANDLDDDGQWYAQGKITFSASAIYRTEVLGFVVRENI
jgi:hypothetical protein